MPEYVGNDNPVPAYMSHNHLVIGLGGTGGKIIREIRKMIVVDSQQGGVNFEFLYVDSSRSDLEDRGPAWRVLGKSVALGNAQQLLLEGAGFSELLENVDAYPNIKPWIEPLDVLKRVAKTNVDSTQGGQRRKFGRFLFAAKARQFVDKLNDRVAALRQRNQRTEVVFHVCVGLAGGTGAGTVVDVVAQIRKAYPAATARILIYALLPDREPKAQWDTGNYHANGYATLLELNALAVGSCRPHDVAEDGQRMDLVDPVFNGCYVFYNQNEMGVFVNVERQLPGIVADFMYQKTFGLSWEGLARAENSENGDKADERSSDGSRNERSKRFLTFGIRRLVVPEEEIKEYLTYQFAVQAARQFRFNYWMDGMGFADQPRPGSYHEIVKLADTQQRWLISDEHLTLSCGILPEDAKNSRWKPVPEFWNSFVTNSGADIQKTEPKKALWLAELRKRVDQAFDEGYRGAGGVRRFYEAKLRDRVDIARHVRNAIEAELFGDWRTGQRSIAEVGRLLEALTEHLGEKLRLVDERRANLEKRQEEARGKIRDTVVEWSKLDIIREWLGQGAKLFNRAGEEVKELCTCGTYLEGWLFAKKLLEEINQQVVDLLGVVNGLNATLAETSQLFEAEVGARLVVEREGDRSHKLKFYNREAVVALGRRLVADEILQRQQSQAVRSRLIQRSGEQTVSFTLLRARLDAPTICSTMEEVCEESVQAAHAQFGTEQRRVIGVNIIERLHEDFGASEERLSAFVRDAIAHAGVYMTFNAQEENKQGEGTTGQRRMRTSAVFLPRCPEREAFTNRLIQLFDDNRTTGAFDHYQDGVRSNEITIIRVDNLFPIRFTDALPYLEKKYVSRRKESEDYRYLMHSEGDGSDFPPLYLPTQEKTGDERRPVVILAKVLGLIKERKSPSTGKIESVLFYDDEDGIEMEEILGRNFIEVAAQFGDSAKFRMIDDLVTKRLGAPEFRLEESRREIFKGIVAFINEVKAARNGDAQDEVYLKFLGTRPAIKKLLRLES